MLVDTKIVGVRTQKSRGEAGIWAKIQKFESTVSGGMVFEKQLTLWHLK